MDPDAPALVAPHLNFHRGLGFVVMKIRDIDPAAGRKANRRVEVGFQDRPIAIGEYVLRPGAS
jgi:hypothetical protein